MGGDYTRDVFVAIEGMPLPTSGADAADYQNFTCQVALKNEEQKLNEMGTGLYILEFLETAVIQAQGTSLILC